MTLLKKIAELPKSIILIILITAVIVISSALVELNQSRKEMIMLMEQQSHTLLETMLASSTNALLSSEKLESELKQRLLNNAVLIKELYEGGRVTNKLLEKISSKNNLFRINIFNRNGKKIFTSTTEAHAGMPEKTSPRFMLAPIFNNEEDTLIIGIKSARFMEGSRYAVAVASRSRDAIVLNVDAAELLNFRKQVGFGVLLKDITGNSNIIYAILQDDEGIIAAAGDEKYFDHTDAAEINLDSLKSFDWRIAEKKDTEIFEARRLFTYQGKEVGVFRVGLSMEPIENINARITRRIIIMSILLFAFGSVSIGFIFIRQNFLLLSRKYASFKEYSQAIIENIGESIMLLDSKGKIKSANKATEAIFNIPPESFTGKKFGDAFSGNACGDILLNPSSIFETTCGINGKNKTLLISKSSFPDEKQEENIILVIKDLTEIKELERQSERNERLAAMGELASAVAHEIRNPLNSISTIVQQLNKDFEPKENREEYNTFTRLVYSEVNRINTTIETFLRFARPVELKKERFAAGGIMEQLKNQYSALLKERNIELEINNGWNGEVEWDRNQILQVLINIIQNSIDAIGEKGKIEISLKPGGNEAVEISVKDNGKGMDEKTASKIFNLYFTTKPKGNGIGLSIVQKIIAGHKGRIKVESAAGAGTAVIIILPKSI